MRIRKSFDLNRDEEQLYTKKNFKPEFKPIIENF